MSKVKITEDNVWQYFDKSEHSVIQAKCKYCEFDDCYIELNEVFDHICHDNDTFMNAIKRRIRETPRVYDLVECISCRYLKTVGEHIKYYDHVMSYHFEEVKKWEMTSHFKIDNFRIECKLCSGIFSVYLHRNVSGHTERYHADKLSPQKTYDVGSLKRVPLPCIITSEKNLWDNYTKLNIFRAKCNLCLYERHYMKLESKFYRHLLEKHQEVSGYEAEYGTKEELWRYFCYYSKDYVRCFICLKFECPPKRNYLNEHMERHRSEKIDLNCFDKCNWILKYCIESKERNGKTSVKCNVPNCNDKMDVEFNFEPFDDHYKSHQAGPSGETPSKKTKEGNSSKD